MKPPKRMVLATERVIRVDVSDLHIAAAARIDIRDWFLIGRSLSSLCYHVAIGIELIQRVQILTGVERIVCELCNRTGPTSSIDDPERLTRLIEEDCLVLRSRSHAERSAVELVDLLA